MAKRRSITVAAPLRITEQQYRRLCDEDSGKCLACGDESDGFVEPDARGYKCHNCGEMAVMGAEEMLVQSLIEIR
jgi:Zn finger protein HypA/HybF involved in hydrogenase expression